MYNEIQGIRKISVFLKNFQSIASTALLLVIKKNPANGNDCKLKSLARMSCCPDSCIKGMVCILLGKTLNFSVTPCSM